MKPIFLSKSQREQLDLQRQNHQSKPQLESRSPKRARVDKLSEHERERKKQQLQAIKEQHLGYSTKPRTRVVKPSQKFRFSFDWDTSEDTSLDIDSLYQNPHEANPLFGRGFYAGMDRVEQKKTSSAKNEVVNQHWTKKNLGEMTERDWRIFREDFGISYKGSYSSSKYIIPHPIRTWKESELSENILKAVEKAGYKKPSPIQMAAIPVGLRRCDTIGVAETGSGKTAAFLLPMLDYVSKQPLVEEDNETAGPHVVVLVPTHELAQQIEKEVVKLARYLDGVRVVSIVGGKSIQEQAFSFRKGCEVIIATPGRLIDCLEQRYVVLNQCNYVILDEADRMIDLGFEPQIVRVLDALPSSNLKPDSEEVDGERVYRSTFMFSATMPPGVERLARKYLRNPVVVTVGTAGKAADVITQRVIMMKESEKKVKLKRLIDEIGDNRVIVFANSRTNVDTVAKDLDRGGYNVTTLRGGMSQEQREISLEGFKTRKYNVLVATDVAGRGIDIPDVAHVINYEMPGKIEMYMHRIGRTGRAGKKGVATTFLTLSDSNVFYDLKHVLIQSNCHVPHELASHGASKVMPGTIPERPSRYGTALDP